MDAIKKYAEDLWDKAIKRDATPEELIRESRKLQDEIYEHRRICPLIFDWVYRKLRLKSEEQMTKSAQTLIEEALNHYVH